MNDQPTPGAEDDSTAVLAPDDPAQDGNTATPVPVDSTTARSGDGGGPSDTLPPPFGT
ncbi:hypothetical protein [Streptomyces sp. NBC_00328]|uniref:hypothetical protein n=1 Tax=Streptomyces sp. NBC_00328 TaxID=2903646 RepID=UPI002E2BC608|nr:hypothetical protein [Streptomyces sp. NBC_00328]